MTLPSAETCCPSRSRFPTSAPAVRGTSASSGSARRWSGQTPTGSFAASASPGWALSPWPCARTRLQPPRTEGFGFFNVRVPGEDDLETCATHLDGLGIRHTPVISGARGRLVGFHDPDGHELSFYAETHPEGVRSDAVRTVRATGDGGRDGRGGTGGVTGSARLMTNVVHHHPAPRLGLRAAPRLERALEAQRSAGRRGAATATVAVVACLVAGLILLVAAYSDIDTGGRVPRIRSRYPHRRPVARAATEPHPWSRS